MAPIVGKQQATGWCSQFE